MELAQPAVVQCPFCAAVARFRQPVDMYTIEAVLNRHFAEHAEEMAIPQPTRCGSCSGTNGEHRPCFEVGCECECSFPHVVRFEKHGT